MPTPDELLAKDPNFLLGYIEATRALVLAVAGAAIDREEFLAAGLQRLESLRTALHAEPVAERRLEAIDRTERWLRHVTSDN